jgi:5-formyltetrahydrofolate cyclo-ligase
MNGVSPISLDKLSLRAQLRAARDAFVAEPHVAIAPPADWLARLRPGLCVASYLPLGSEADPAPLVAAAREAGCDLALPRTTTRAAPIGFHRWDENTVIETGSFGLRQPSADSPVVRPDIVLVPLVGFDSACNRLGQGAGHYDRALERLPDAATLGVAWSVQQVAALPVDPWDRPLDMIVTETACFHRSRAA